MCDQGGAGQLPDDVNLLRQIIDQASVGMVLVGPDLRWIYANPLFCTVVGYSQSECVGMTVSDVMHPDDLAEARDDIAALHEGRLGAFRKDRRYVRKDGSIVWVTVNVTSLSTPSHIQPPLHIVQIIDIEGQKRASSVLKAQSRENTIYRAMIEALPDLIFAKDLEGRFLAGNTAAANFVGKEHVTEVIGRTDADFYAPDVARRLRDDEEAFFVSGQTAQLEQVIDRIGGTRVVLQSVKSLLVDEDGRTIGYVGHGRDITVEKHREEALADAYAQLQVQNEELQGARWVAEQANMAKSQFLASMSHEIRTPMTSVLGMADLLASEELTPAQRHYIETIRKSGTHLLSIINDILDFSRIEAGRLDLEKIDFLPEDILKEVHALLMPQATERGLDFRIERTPGPDLVVQGDPTRLRQILVNLASNALKFTSQGSVSILASAQALSAEAARLRFEVTDTGIGIPPERHGQLFQAFVQADSSISRQFGGSGLGLAICRRLVAVMGGSIGMHSEPGHGSTFWFELPMARGDALRVTRRGMASLKVSRPLRVLVVDDVSINRELLSEMLRRSGHEVEQAENGEAAVTMVQQRTFDAVLMDVQMPVMNGIEATRRIRMLPGPARDVAIFALTANVMESEQKRYVAAGMNACLTKPVIWDDLFAALATVVGDGADLPLRPADPEAIPDPAREGPEPPLLDRARIDGLSSKMPPAMVRQMLVRGLDGAAESCRRLQAAGTDSTALAAEAHRLRGTAGTFGLTLISVLAGRLEDALPEHPAEAAALIPRLLAAVHATDQASRTLLDGGQAP